MPNSFATPWTVAHQAPLSMGFPRQEYWSGLPCSLPGDILDPGIEPMCLLHWQEDSFNTGKPDLLYATAKSLQSCPTLCDPMDCSLSDSSVHGIFQARILEWVAMLSSRGSSWPEMEPASLRSPALTGRVLYH